MRSVERLVLLGMLLISLMLVSPVFAPPGDNSSDVADNPLTTSFTMSGKLDVVVAAVAFSYANDPSGTLTVAGIPGGSTAEMALLYGHEWEFSAGETASATLAGNALPAISPLTNDPDGGLNLAVYRWDVTSIVTGNGAYAFTTSGLERNFGMALAVVFSNPANPSREVRINDGAESMGEIIGGVTASTSFAGVGAGSGTLFLFFEADDAVQTGETISFNGAVVGEPIDMNLGEHASLFTIPVTTVDGVNTVDVNTPIDWFGWHLAILVSPGAVAPVPEFGLATPAITSIMAALYLSLNRLRRRKYN